MMTYEEQEKIERLVAKDENAQKTAEMVGLAAIKYGDLSNQASKDYPLTYIDSSVQWIQKMHPEVEHFEFWDQIKNDLQYMRVLLDDISAFNNGDKLNICKIDPVEFACDLKDTLLPELLAHHIPLLLKLDNTYPDFYADPVRLKQVFINLLTNAIDSIEERGRITLKIFTTTNGCCWQSVTMAAASLLRIRNPSSSPSSHTRNMEPVWVLPLCAVSLWLMAVRSI